MKERRDHESVIDPGHTKQGEKRKKKETFSRWLHKEIKETRKKTHTTGKRKWLNSSEIKNQIESKFVQKSQEESTSLQRDVV